MESENVFVYSWCEDKSETEVTALRVYGLNTTLTLLQHNLDAESERRGSGDIE